MKSKFQCKLYTNACISTPPPLSTLLMHSRLGQLLLCCIPATSYFTDRFRTSQLLVLLWNSLVLMSCSYVMFLHVLGVYPIVIAFRSKKVNYYVLAFHMSSFSGRGPGSTLCWARLEILHAPTNTRCSAGHGSNWWRHVSCLSCTAGAFQ